MLPLLRYAHISTFAGKLKRKRMENLVEFNDVRLRSPFSGTRDLAPAIAARLFKPKLYGSRQSITVENP